MLTLVGSDISYANDDGHQGVPQGCIWRVIDVDWTDLRPAN